MAHELGRDGKDLWQFLTLSGEADAMFQDIMLASKFFRPHPQRMRQLSDLLERYEVEARQFRSYLCILPVCTMPEEVIRLHVMEYASADGTIGRKAVEGQIQFALQRHKRWMENGGHGPAGSVSMMIFESKFAAAAAGKKPFATLDSGQRYDMIQSLIEDTVRERNALVWLVNDTHPDFPKHLRDRYERVDHVLAIDNRLVVQRRPRSFDRLWFERECNVPQVGEYIDDELAYMAELSRWVHHGKSKTSVIERLKNYLPE